MIEVLSVLSNSGGRPWDLKDLAPFLDLLVLKYNQDNKLHLTRKQIYLHT